MTAMQKMEQAFNDQRKAFYGDIWELVDWYGNPKSDLSDAQKQRVKAIRTEQMNAEYRAYKGAA